MNTDNSPVKYDTVNDISLSETEDGINLSADEFPMNGGAPRSLNTTDAGDLQDEGSSNNMGSSQMLCLLDEFTKIYFDRLNRVEEAASKCNESQYLQKKVGVLQSWVHDLGEQNQVLVVTVEELEKEAAERVMLLQEKLNKMAMTTRESCISLRDHHSQVSSVMSDKVDLEKETSRLREQLLSLEQSSACLRQENNNLSHDLHTLVQVVTHARLTGDWDTENCNFTCISPDKVFGSEYLNSRLSSPPPQASDKGSMSGYASTEALSRKDPTSIHESLCNINDMESAYSSQIASKEAVITKLKTELELLKNLREENNNVLSDRDKHIADLQAQLTDLHHKLTAERKFANDESRALQEIKNNRRSSLEKEDLLHQLMGAHVCHKTGAINDGSFVYTDDVRPNTLAETQLNENIDVLLTRLSDLEEDCQELRDKYTDLQDTHSLCSSTIETLQTQLNRSKQSQEDLREVLTAEVAERHDQVVALRGQLKEGQNSLQETNMQLQLKVEVIKNLRKELKELKQQQDTTLLHGNNGTGYDRKLEKEVQTTATYNDLEVVTDGCIHSPSSTDAFSKLATLNLQVIKLQNELTEKNILIRELQNHLASSRQELHLKDETLNKVETKLDNTRREGGYREDRVHYLTSQLTLLQLEIGRTHGHSEQLQRQVENKNELIQKLEIENTSLSHQLNEKSGTMERLQRESKLISVEGEKWKKQASEQRLTIGTLQDALVATKQTCDKLRVQLEADVSDASSNVRRHASPTNSGHSFINSIHDSFSFSPSYYLSNLPRSLTNSIESLSSSRPDDLPFASLPPTLARDLQNSVADSKQSPPDVLPTVPYEESYYSLNGNLYNPSKSSGRVLDV